MDHVIMVQENAYANLDFLEVNVILNNAKLIVVMKEFAILRQEYVFVIQDSSETLVNSKNVPMTVPVMEFVTQLVEYVNVK